MADAQDQQTPPMSQCEELEPLLAAAALGDASLDAPARAHLQACPACRRTLQEYAAVARMLPLSLSEEPPPPALRDRIVAAVESADAAERAPAPAAPRANPAGRPAARPQWRWWGALGGALAVILGLLGWNIALQQQVAQQATQLTASREGWSTLIVLMDNPAVQVHRIAGQSASGTFWAAPDSNVGCIMVEGLPNAAEGQVYQIWLRRGGEWVSAGMYDARPGKAWYLIEADGPLGGYSAVTVTLEPAGGSPAPSGPEVVRGSLGFTRT